MATIKQWRTRIALFLAVVCTYVADFSLDIRQGEFLVIVGPSGCGKTTVLNLLAGLETASAGRMTIDGVAINGPGADRGVMFQDYALDRKSRRLNSSH